MRVDQVLESRCELLPVALWPAWSDRACPS